MLRIPDRKLRSEQPRAFAQVHDAAIRRHAAADIGAEAVAEIDAAGEVLLRGRSRILGRRLLGFLRFGRGFLFGLRRGLRRFLFGLRRLLLRRGLGVSRNNQ